MATLKLWTDGLGLTNTINDLVRSGQFYNAIEILKDGGIDNNYVKGFLLGKYKLIGDTRNGDLEMVETNTESKDLFNGWSTTSKTYITSDDKDRPFDLWDFETVERYTKTDTKHLKSLFSVFATDELKNIFKFDILKSLNYKMVTLEDDTPLEQVRDGVILENGTFIEVSFECHRYLYPILEQLNLSDNDGDEWGHRERKCIRISDFRVCGKVATMMADKWDRGSYKNITITDQQIQALFKWREHFPNLYNKMDGKVMDAIRRYLNDQLGLGAKYGNLAFLKRFTELSTPKIDLLPLEGRYALRTSPTKSIAGLLESKFDVTKETHDEKVSEMMETWSKYDDIIGENEIHIFSQEIIEGKNGVCHYKRKGDFSYSVSHNRGDVVQGVHTNDSLNNAEYDYIRRVSSELHFMLGKQIQLEFVCNADGVHIVQLRTINTPLKDERVEYDKSDFIGSGRSYSSGVGTFNIEDALIVDSQCDSKELLDKKCLIVREMVDFSHALTLSETLGIPSIYGVGDVEIPNRFVLNTKNNDGLILKTSNEIVTL